MKKRPSPLWPPCSKINFRRNRLKFWLLPILLLTICSSLGASTIVNIEQERNSISVSMAFNDYEMAELEDSLTKGLKAEIIFTIQLYREASGLFSFLGDKLIREDNPAKEAAWDMLNRNYVIRDSFGGIMRYKNWNDFLADFFSLDSYTIKTEGGETVAYLVTRIEYSSVKLSPAMQILSFFKNPDTIITTWSKSEL
jgi:hypothetical protein